MLRKEMHHNSRSVGVCLTEKPILKIKGQGHKINHPSPSIHAGQLGSQFKTGSL